MLKSILLILITIAALSCAGVFVQQAVSVNRDRHELSQARKDCSDKIPNDAKSVSVDSPFVSFGDNQSTPSTAASFTRYPAFDRCMASKGF